MPRGGYRPGSGPAKGTKYKPRAKPAKNPAPKKTKPKKEMPADIVIEAEAAKLTPLEYILGVINDPNAAVERKDRLAGIALPFTVPKPGEHGKKQAQEERAKAAVAGRFAPSRPPLKAVK